VQQIYITFPLPPSPLPNLFIVTSTLELYSTLIVDNTNDGALECGGCTISIKMNCQMLVDGAFTIYYQKNELQYITY
jgi:hypothetical protein